jgi:hypothetical protein
VELEGYDIDFSRRGLGKDFTVCRALVASKAGALFEIEELVRGIVEEGLESNCEGWELAIGCELVCWCNICCGD